MDTTILQLHDASVSYGKNTAARDICFSLNRGGCAALYGPGTAGHHALADFLGGKCVLVSGTAVINGHAVEEGCRVQAAESGIVFFEPFTPQVRLLSVLEYFYLVRAGKYASPFWNEKKLADRARTLLDAAGFGSAVHTQLGKISAADYFQLQCAKAADMDQRVVIYTEDISGFPDTDMNKFRTALSMLKAYGISSVVCADALPDEQEWADRIYVFRDGTIVKKLESGTYDRKKALAYVQTADPIPAVNGPVHTAPFFSVSGLTGTAAAEGALDFTVCRAETVNIINYSFAVRDRMFKALTGRMYVPGLNIRLGGEWIRPVTYEFLYRKKIAAVRSFAEAQDGFPKLSVAENLVLPSVKKICRAGLFVTDRAGKALYRQVRQVYPGLPERMDDCSLSERICVRMESLLVFGPDVLIMLDPFFLLDSKCRTVVKNYIYRFNSRGTAVLIISSGGSAYASVCTRTIRSGGGGDVWK